MKQFAIISSSIRIQRNSHFVALYFKSYIEKNNLGSVEILDLNEYNFPLFDERMRFQKDPSDKVLDFAARVENADGIIIVTPEYNGGYPASLKNAIDVLHKEWYHKPVAISTVSDGNFGGSQVIISLQFILWKIKAWTVPAMFPVPDVKEVFDAQGVPVNRETLDKRADTFIKELLWCIEAKRRMNDPLQN